ncbi:SpaH/EbpB family LPXTG-anchored major pilin [Actinomyces minihominis]|uniref:SpaH/EbpB family LPXTG-anchored major pilin n=1 Tax=Actinomyces minihominis TaxID=2002838 RepID=UPI000C086D91|nr:SpaH/EbpB family LPXTG-anchored major pilin [Actinomyces minihominis]
MSKHSIAGLLTASALLAASATTASAAPPNLIPDDAMGSITIYKFVQPPSYLPDNQGMAVTSGSTSGLTPLSGATFRIQQVSGINLKSNPGWQEAQALVDSFDPLDPGTITQSGHTLTGAKTLITDVQGIAKFSSLPVGLYLVEETAAPEVAPNAAVTKSLPFLITVPLTDPSDRSSWVYDVHAYPKNVISEVEKSVTDAPIYALGQEITYSIDSTIPGGAQTTKYIVTDQLDPKLKYLSTNVRVSGTPTADFTATHTGGLVTVTLGASARKAAFDALQTNPSAKVTVSHTAQVIAAGEIANDATLTFQREDEHVTEVPSTVVETKFGGINVFKKDRDGKSLAGAIFEVHASHTNDFSTAAKVTVNGTGQWQSGADGKVTISGLRYSNWADGKQTAVGEPGYNHYWLVETKAPAGFELLAKPIPFTVTSQIESAATIEVVNTPHNAGGTLPLTGAAGTTGIIIAGLALIAVGGGAVAFSRSRREL